MRLCKNPAQLRHSTPTLCHEPASVLALLLGPCQTSVNFQQVFWASLMDQLTVFFLSVNKTKC